MRKLKQQALMFAIMIAAAGLAGGCGWPRRGFVFDVAADMRFYTPPEYVGQKYFAGVCQAIRELGPGEFMVVLGDLDPPGRVRATLDEVLGKEYVWYPVVGNHELDEPEHLPYLRACNPGGNALPGIVRSGPPGAVETCYSFDRENAHFAVINQYYDGQGDGGADGDVGGALYEWLEEDLAENGKPVVFVFGHEPVVSVPDMSNGRVRHRGDSLDKYAESNHRFWSLLRGHDVVAYFCGHTHNASVSKINGVWQIDCGHARGIGDPGAASTFVRVFVNGGEVVCAVYRQVGEGGPYRLVYEERLR